MISILRRATLVPCVVALLLVTASFSNTGPTATAQNTVLRIVAAEPKTGLDPNTANQDTSWRVQEMIFDTLVDYNAKLQVVPDIAKSWDISTDHSAFTFHLQPDAKFSDGSPITADDVKFSLERAKTGHTLGAQLSNVRAIDVIDQSTVRITLTAPSRTFLDTLAHYAFAAILSRKAVGASPDYFTKPTTTSGPWYLQEYLTKDHATLVANPYYWRKGYPKLKTVRYTFCEDPTSCVTAVESRSADMFYPWPAPAVQHARDTKTAVIYEVLRQAALYWGLDKTRPPFNDVRVRQAFAYVVPRLRRQQVCWYGTGTVSYGNLIQSWNWAYTPVMTYKVSETEGMSKAAALLDSAGWKMGPNGVRVSHGVEGLPDGTALHINVPYESDWQQAQCSTELLQQTLKPLGVDIAPDKYDAATFWDDVAKNKFQMFHGGNGAPNVDDFMVNFLTTKGALTNIVSKWSNPEVDKLVVDAVNSMDRERAKADYARVEQIVANQLPMIVTGSQSGLLGTSPNLHGFESRPDNSNRSLVFASF